MSLDGYQWTNLQVSLLRNFSKKFVYPKTCLSIDTPVNGDNVQDKHMLTTEKEVLNVEHPTIHQ